MLFSADCVVLFYENFSTTYRYTRIGHLEDAAGLAEALESGSFQIVFQIPDLS